MFDWKTINTVLLDMDGTLLDLHFDNYFWQEHLPMRYAEQNNMSFDALVDSTTLVLDIGASAGTFYIDDIRVVKN